MPLYKSIAIDNETHLLIWEITESEDDLKSSIKLGVVSTQRLTSMKSEVHRRAYLSVRHLLAIAQYTDEDLTYSSEGKPMLSDGVCVSITHSHQYSGIIFSSKPVGIDIEKQRDKIELIANKFISPKEEEYMAKIPAKEKVKALTFIWCTKESMYKLYGEKGVSFKEHMDVAPFQLVELQTKGSINFKESINFFDVYSVEFNGFICVFVC